MRTWRLLLAVLLCSGLCVAFGLSGCGDDDDDDVGLDPRCAQACSKIIDCAADFSSPVPGEMTVQECIIGCASDPVPETECGFSCDENAECPEYAECIEIDCGITFD